MASTQMGVPASTPLRVLFLRFLSFDVLDDRSLTNLIEGNARCRIILIVEKFLFEDKVPSLSTEVVHFAFADFTVDS